MAEVNKAILRASMDFLNGKLDADGREDYCLSFVRGIVEDSQGWPWGQLYKDYLTQGVTPAAHYPGEIWARDAEKNLRDLGMAVHRRKPGDLLFVCKDAWSSQWDAYIGHVSIFMPGEMVLENIRPSYRPHSFHRGNISLTPINYWLTPTTIIRFDPDKKPGGS